MSVSSVMVRGKFNRTAQRSESSYHLGSDQHCLRVVASRGHLGEREQQIVARLRKRFGDLEMVNMGGSLKFCLLAEGGADFYPDWRQPASGIPLRPTQS